jgi:hypothetical protein
MTTTMPIEAEYVQGSDLPDLEVAWFDSKGDPVDMSSGYTFEAKVGTLEVTEFAKSSGITGTVYGCVIAWAAVDELNTLEPSRYTLEITATRTVDSRQRKQQLSLKIKPQLPEVVP